MIACMLNFDLVSILFGTFIPTSFNILVKMFLHLFHWFLLCVATCINLLAFVLPPLHTYDDSQQLAVTPTSCLVRILHTEYNSGPVMATVSRSKKRTQRSNAGSQTAQQTTTTTKLLTSCLWHVSKQANGV